MNEKRLNNQYFNILGKQNAFLKMISPTETIFFFFLKHEFKTRKRPNVHTIKKKEKWD